MTYFFSLLFTCLLWTLPVSIFKSMWVGFTLFLCLVYIEFLCLKILDGRSSDSTGLFVSIYIFVRTLIKLVCDISFTNVITLSVSLQCQHLFLQGSFVVSPDFENCLSSVMWTHSNGATTNAIISIKLIFLCQTLLLYTQ